MTGRDALLLGARFLSAYFVLSAVIELPPAIGSAIFMIDFAKTHPQVVVVPPWLVVAHVGPAVLQLVLGVAIWLTAGGLASRMEAGMPAAPDSAHVGRADQFLTVATCALGVFLAATSIRTVVWSGFRLFGSGLSLSNPFSASAFAQVRYDFIGSLVSLALGLGLVFGASAIGEYLARSRGRRESERSPGN